MRHKDTSGALAGGVLMSVALPVPLRSRQAEPMDAFLVLTHLAAAFGGGLVGWSMFRRRS